MCCAIALAACEDILEKDLSNQEVVLIAPGEEVLVKQKDLTFLWEPVQGASGYLLQVVSPSFDKPETVVLDTFIVSTRFNHALAPGRYEWRVSAENSAYYTPYASRSFVVDTATGQDAGNNIKLISPRNGFLTKESTLEFVWNKVSEATHYQVQISGATEMILSTKDTTAGLGFTAVNDTLYWQVKAILPGQGKSVTSQIRWFYIDQTPPTGSALLTPTEGSVFSPQDDIAFSWEGNTTADFDHYRFTLFEKMNDQLVPLMQKDQKETTFNHIASAGGLAVGQYLWEIQTVDRLGNISKEGAITRGFEIR